MARPGVTSKFPLLPVKPVRYRRLAEKATSNASSFRSTSPSAMARRRGLNSSAATLQLPKQNFRTMSQRFGNPNIAFALGFIRLLDEPLDLIDQPALAVVELAQVLLIENLS